MIRLAGALAIAFVLPGCASVVQEDWHDRPTHAPLPARHFEVPEKDLPRLCGNHAGMKVHGCAIRVAEARVCLIYTPPQPAAWLMAHERKHCDGWDHGPTRGDLRVTAASFQ